MSAAAVVPLANAGDLHAQEGEEEEEEEVEKEEEKEEEEEYELAFWVLTFDISAIRLRWNRKTLNCDWHVDIHSAQKYRVHIKQH